MIELKREDMEIVEPAKKTEVIDEVDVVVIGGKNYVCVITT
jgi:hypothetical protein